MKILISLFMFSLFFSCELHEQSAYMNSVGDETTFNLEKVDTLFAAMISNDYEFLRTELTKDRSLANITNDQGQILFVEATKLKKILLVSLFIEHGANVHTRDLQGINVYDVIGSFENKDVWINLFDNGIMDNDFLNDELISLVSDGAVDNQSIVIEQIEIYLDKGANINIRNARSYTILAIAASNGLSDIVIYLCERGDVDINASVGRYTTLGLIEKLMQRNTKLKVIKDILVSYGAI